LLDRESKTRYRFRIAYLTIKVNANLIEVVKLHKNNVLKLCEMPKVIIRENK